MGKIGVRLSEAVSLLTGAEILADVGCDHGYFPIAAILAGKALRAIASDDKELPLAKAQKNILKAGLSEQIETILADGLSFLKPGIDAVSIMGMGGTTMRDILDEGDLSDVKTLLLEPNNDHAAVRGWLETHGWKITAERFVRDQGQDYQLMLANRGEMHLSEAERTFGPLILREKNPLFIDHIRRKIHVLSTALAIAKEPEKIAALAVKIHTLEELIR